MTRDIQRLFRIMPYIVLALISMC